MKDMTYHRYMMIFDNDKKWGFYIKDLGSNSIQKSSLYPSKGHPGQYMFSWNKGRVLEEFHFVLITKGQGVFESKETGKVKINSGDAFILFPGMWHRYKPDLNTGWNEQWVGFSGHLAFEMMNNGFFDENHPIIRQCNRTSMQNYFETLFKLFHNEPFGYQRLAAGICMQLMAEVYNIQQSKNNDDSVHTLVAYAKHMMYKKIDSSLNLEKLAEDYGVSYTKLRTDFKNQTGSSPLQYYLQLKIEKSKELLLRSNKTQKEIAFSLGFESDYYFGRLFKSKVGMTPKAFRKSKT